MRKLTDKIIIFIICCILYSSHINNPYMIVPILVSIFLSAMLSYLEEIPIIILILITCMLLCFTNSSFLFFIPVFCYDMILIRPKWIWLSLFLPLIINYNKFHDTIDLLITAFILASYILKKRTASLESLERDYYELRNSTKEISLQLERQNKELLEKKDYEINLATLTERNRIARDIHDNVGHLLSRCILQVGALLATNEQIEIRENLSLIKDTLSEAMDSIRSSVHDLHEKAIDLQSEMEKLIYSFKFCPIKFNYEMESIMGKNIKHCFITVAKEALSNIAKHSNASEASITICEHPALYQLIIEDNGSNVSCNAENGIGIKNMIDRVASIEGNINISTHRGFRIFISVPKK